MRTNGETLEIVGKTDFIQIEPGDRLIFDTAGAGGWGDALARPAERVVADIDKGFVTPEAAREFYGVVVGDDEATAALRREMARDTVPLFDFGPRPPGYEATVDNPDIAPLGAAQAIEPRSIDMGLLDSRE